MSSGTSTKEDPLVQVVAKLSDMHFGKLDLEADDRVTKAELKTALDSCGEYGEWAAEILFEIIDDDSNGWISPAEFFKWKVSMSDKDLLQMLKNKFLQKTLTAVSEDAVDSGGDEQPFVEAAVGDDDPTVDDPLKDVVTSEEPPQTETTAAETATVSAISAQQKMQRVASNSEEKDDSKADASDAVEEEGDEVPVKDAGDGVTTEALLKTETVAETETVSDKRVPATEKIVPQKLERVVSESGEKKEDMATPVSVELAAASTKKKKKGKEGEQFAEAVAFLSNMDFSKMDTSGDTKVTIDELQTAMEGAGEHREWVATTVFAIIDKDDNGWISAKELWQWKEQTTAEDMLKILNRMHDSVAIEMQQMAEIQRSKTLMSLANGRKAFWQAKEDEIEEEKQREFEEETALTQHFTEYFDLSMGLQIRPVHELYDSNYRPLMFSLLNIVLMLPSQVTTYYYLASAPGVLFNAFILLVGAIAELGSFNLAEVYCGDCGRRAFSYTPGKHYSVLDSWFNIEAYRDKSMGMTLTHEDKQEEHAMFAHEERDEEKEKALLVKGDSIAFDDEEREERELKHKLREIRKGRERMANMQIVPPPFSYVATLGFLLVHLILGASNAFYSSAIVISPGYKGDRRSSWNQYCKGDDWDTKTARQNGECLIRFSAYLAVASFSSFALFCSVILVRNVASRPMSWIKVAKSSLLAKFPGNEADNIPSSRALMNRIERRLMRIKSMHHYKWHFDCCGHKIVVQYITVLNVLFSALLILGSLCTRYKWLYEVKAKYWWAHLIFGVSVFLATHSLSVILHVLFRVYALYSIGLQVMVALAKPITVRTIEDLVIWWETRKYFQNFKLPVVYAYGAMSVVFLLILSLVSIFFLTINIVTANKDEAFRKNLRSPTNVLVSLLILLFVYALFKVLLLVVKISSMQRKHEVMLRHEMARLDAYGALYTRRLKEKQLEEKHEANQEMALSIAMASTVTSAHSSDTDESESESDDDLKQLISGAGVSMSPLKSGSPVAMQSMQRLNTISGVWAKMRSSWLDMKMEREVAGVGKDSHRLVETMIYLVSEKDVYPRVLGVPVTKNRLLALSTYFAVSVVSVVVKLVLLSKEE